MVLFVFAGLIEHGRLSVGQLVERASARTEDEAERCAYSGEAYFFGTCRDIHTGTNGLKILAFTGLIEHGRLSVGQLVERASARTEDEAERSAQSEGVKEAFKQLIQARYVEKAPQAEPVLPPVSEGETKKGTRINAR